MTIHNPSCDGYELKGKRLHCDCRNLSQIRVKPEIGVHAKPR